MKAHLKTMHNSLLLAMCDAGIISQIDVNGMSQILNSAIKKHEQTKPKDEDTECLYDESGRVL